MVLLCFVLDLESFNTALLKALKQCLLRLGNLYALRAKRSPALISCNGVAVCYTRRNNVSGTHELHVVYKPEGQFDLREFHHKVSGIPVVGPSMSKFRQLGTGPSQGYFQVSCLSGLLKGEDGLVSWGTSDVSKKVVMLSSLFTENSTALSQTIWEAAEQLVEFQFIQVEQAHDGKTGIQQGEVLRATATLDFTKCVSEFDNCTFENLKWDPWVLPHLAKRWIQEILSDREGPIEVILDFPGGLGDAVSSVYCSFQAAIMQLEQTLKPCQTCRCHGEVLAATICIASSAGVATCPVTGQKLDALDCVAHGLLIGSESVLCFPSFKTPLLLPADTYNKDGPPIVFKVTRCLALDTVDEGLCFGIPQNVVPSMDFDIEPLSDESVNIENNERFFVGLCQELQSKNSGLLCTATFDMDSRAETSFISFYVLVPAENGLSFVARRIAGEEDVLPAQRCAGASPGLIVPDHVRSSVSNWLSKTGVHPYSPLVLERGCHSKLTWLAKESLQFRRTHGFAELELLQVENHTQISRSHRSIPAIFRPMKPLKTAGLLPKAADGRALEHFQGTQSGGITASEASQNTQGRMVDEELSSSDPFQFNVPELTPRPSAQVPPPNGQRGGARKLSLPVCVTPRPLQASQPPIPISQPLAPSQAPTGAARQPIVRRFGRRRSRQM